MNILKHMEVVFVVTLGLACSATFALESMPAAPQQAASNVAVVVVAGKRMTAAEKQQSLLDEHKLAARQAAPSKT